MLISQKIKNAVKPFFKTISILGVVAVLGINVLKYNPDLGVFTDALTRASASLLFFEKEGSAVATTKKENKKLAADSPSDKTEDLTINANLLIPAENRVSIQEKQITSSISNTNFALKSGFLYNTTDLEHDTVSSLLERKLSLKLEKTDLPQVLLFSTHTTESYLSFDLGYYDKTAAIRNMSAAFNVLAVGKTIKDELEKSGVKSIQITEISDEPYTGAYDRSRALIERVMAEYPSIKVLIDVHRDHIQYSDGSRGKPTAVIDGKKAAQLMIITGCDNGNMNFPNWRENLDFAVRLQEKTEEMFPGLTKPILFDYRKYNMDVTPASLLLEFGSSANTLEEAKYTGTLVARALTKLLQECGI